VTDNDNGTSLLCCGIYYGSEKFYETGPGREKITNFFKSNFTLRLRMLHFTKVSVFKMSAITSLSKWYSLISLLLLPHGGNGIKKI
jgi:hypothetical protein